jgi:hypothetical protein
MSWMRHEAWGIRKATAVSSILALVFHVAVMALGAGRMPAVAPGAGGVHAQHGHAKAGHGTDLPKESAAHKAPCCILSLCPGLPGPPAVSADACLPQPEAVALVFQMRAHPVQPRISLFRPVGARAPPVPV